MTLGNDSTAPGVARPAVEMFRPVHLDRMSNRIADQLRLLIRDGRLSAGDRLPAERELGERFGVSRVTVREALRRLEASGLVKTKVGANGGAFVTAPSSARVGQGISDLLSLSVVTPAEVTEARRVLELGIVGMVCDRADDEDIAELVEICDWAEVALHTGTADPVSLSADFHVRVARATHNPAIEIIAQSFRAPLLALLHGDEEHPDAEVLDTSEHREFVTAVQQRDVSAATAVMTEHLARTAERLRAH